MVEESYLYRALLSYNYFPMVRLHRDELPPLFSTVALTPEIADNVLQLVESENFSAKYNKYNKNGSDQIEYRVSRFNNVSRIMHIPTPLAYIQFCGILRDSWNHPELNRISNNPSSRVRPEQHEDGRTIVMDEYDKELGGRVIVMGWEDREQETLAMLSQTTGMCYYVEADISACFASIYSHSIPWALVGHDEAKRQRNSSDEWYNRVDKYQRLMKRGETQGVPIGPATSNIVTEIVLYPVDEALRGKGYTFSRYIDDYRAYTQTREKAEEFIRDLERELSKYLLSLNAGKIKIRSLPRAFVEPWILELRSRLFDRESLGAGQVLDYLDYAVTLNEQEPDGSVVKFAARSIADRLTDDGRIAYCTYMLNLAVHFPVVLPILCSVVANSKIEISCDLLNKLIRKHILHRRSDAIAWTVYLYNVSQNPVPIEVASEIVASDDCMAMAALLAIKEHEKLVESFVTSLNTNYRFRLDQYWILIHEINRCSKLPSDDQLVAYVNSTGLDLLKRENVSFLLRPEAHSIEVKELGY